MFIYLLIGFLSILPITFLFRVNIRENIYILEEDKFLLGFYIFLLFIFIVPFYPAIYFYWLFKKVLSIGETK